MANETTHSRNDWCGWVPLITTPIKAKSRTIIFLTYIVPLAYKETEKLDIFAYKRTI